jgi:hypothetical protein
MARLHNSKERIRIAGNGGASVAVAEPDHSSNLDQDEVARLAYSYWLARGCPEGSPEEDWLRAEQEVQGGTCTDNSLRRGRTPSHKS